MTTVAASVAQAAARLAAGPHAERARLDAETLLLHLLDKDRAWLIAHGNDALPAADLARYGQRIDRRCAGEPIQYIAGACEFYGLPLRVTPDVLIPRPETEHLVEKAIALAACWHHPRIVDVGVGSGAIAIALAHALPQAHITAVDVSPAALDVARANALQNRVAQRIEFVQNDLLRSFEEHRFDLVVSNPPYVPLADRPTLSVEVREHEPALALFAGDDGLAIYRRLIPQAAHVLSVGGCIVLEIGYGQSPALQSLLASAGFDNLEFTPDLQAIPRVASGRKR